MPLEAYIDDDRNH